MFVDKYGIRVTYNSTGIEISLEAGLGPRVDGLVKSILGSFGSSVGGLGISSTNVGGGGAKGRSGRGRDGVAHELGAVLANEGAELVDLGALGNIDAVLVAELLELRLIPRVNEFVAHAVVGSLGVGLGTGRCLLHSEVGQAGVAADRGDELVALGGVRFTPLR